MVYLKAGLLCILAYVLTSTLLFGGPFHGLGFLTFWRDRLGLVYWPAVIPFGIVLATITTKVAVRYGMPRLFTPATFISISMVCAAVFIGIWADYQRDRIIGRFGPDTEIRSSIFASFRNAPRDFQFFLHGAALKDCKPYAWSYRQMAFYELSPNVAANVLPVSWIEECNIRRTR